MAGFFRRLFGMGSKGERGDPNVFYIYAKCNRCGEKVRVRIHMYNDLSPTYEDAGPAYTLTKTVVGSKCPNRMEVTFEFDQGRNAILREIRGGDLISRNDYEAGTGGG